MTSYLKMLSKSSLFFIVQAKNNKKDEDLFKYYILSSIIHSWILFEAYINYISDTLARAKLDAYEKAVLQDRECRINDDGELIDIQSHMPVSRRALFILQKFSKVNVKKLKQRSVWKNFKNAEDLRNKLMHPRQFNIDILSLKSAENTRKSLLEFIKKINKSVFNKGISLN